jgi:hypothetical protein
MVGVFVVVVMLAGVLASITTGWQAVVYNRIAAISGGLQVELEPEGRGELVRMQTDERGG